MMQPPPYGSDYDQLLARLRKQVREQNIEGRVLELLQNVFENALKPENLMLAPAEKEKLLKTIIGEVLNKVTERINKGDHA